MIPSTASPLEILWSSLGAICLIAMIWLTTISGTRVYLAHKDQHGEWEIRRAWQLLRDKIVYLILQIMFLWAGIAAMLVPEPVREANAEQQRWTAIVSIGLQLMITVNAIWSWIDYRWLLNPAVLRRTRRPPRTDAAAKRDVGKE